MPEERYKLDSQITLAATYHHHITSLKRVSSQLFARLRYWLLLTIVMSHAVSSQGQGSVVTVDTNNVLVINGQKVFPIGFSPGPPLNGTTPWGTDAMQELRNAGGLLYRMNQ